MISPRNALRSLYDIIQRLEVNALADAEMDVKILMGTFYQSVDAKGRMTFPSKLRECIGERFIVTKGSADCLFVYAREDFYRLAARIAKLPMSEKRENLIRSLSANATEVEPDKQGRILIPANLLIGMPLSSVFPTDARSGTENAGMTSTTASTWANSLNLWRDLIFSGIQALFRYA